MTDPIDLDLDLELELDQLVTPTVAGLLGAVAAKALLGPDFLVTRARGQVLAATVGGWSGRVVATVHPPSVLRVMAAA